MSEAVGGFWAEMWVGNLVGGPEDWPARVVVRMAPDLAVARRETAIQAAVAALGYPTPRIRASGVIAASGRPWSVMDFVAGRPLLERPRNRVHIQPRSPRYEPWRRTKTQGE